MDLGKGKGGVLLSVVTKYLTKYVNTVCKDVNAKDDGKKKYKRFHDLVISIRRELHRQMGADHALQEENTMMFALFIGPNVNHDT